jgi:hypothetical protein
MSGLKRGGYLLKWFKHFSDSLDDPFIVALMDKFGATGYVVWFGTIEIISKENGNEITGELTISPAFLRRKLRTSRTKLREVYEYCQTFARLSFDFSEKEWKLYLPKMADIKDNYTKDLQAACKKLSNHKEVEVEEEKEEEEEFKEYARFFEKFWKAYPARNGKKLNRKLCFDYIRKNKIDRDLLFQAVGNYAKSKNGREGFAKDPIRFLRADFWKEYIEPEKKGDDARRAARLETM